MKAPRLTDDGTTVELDLHGVSVEEAMRLCHRLVDCALERGRKSLRIIHGSSTSDSESRNRTIKHALSEALDRGVPGVATYLALEDWTLLSLDSHSKRDPSRISAADLR